ncbi:hypothetical protein G7Z17_g2226 [Cylindrodendrum hubeiense]|uniref:Uncharacterized protein n=1 Tax=Cylindrodendrum hubeiense TaxID=595255 RepID=A0A9P5HJ87_9HYPO|nr:hypothetical protein G7Z17_g2226 [Cylindrodendrum hubeiense]
MPGHGSNTESMETASAIVSLITASVAIWKTIDAAICSIKNAPARIQHWRAINRLLQTSLSRMEETMKRRKGAGLSISERKHYESIREHLQCFKDDLEDLQHKIASVALPRRFGKRTIPRQVLTALEIKLQEDPHLEKRVDRNIQLFQLSVALLSLLDPAPRTSVRPILTELHALHLQVSDDDDKLRKWKESAHDIAKDAAMREIGFTSSATDRVRVGRQPSINIQPTPQRDFGIDENFNKEELLHKIKVTQDLATRLEEAGMPTIASNFQLDAIKCGEQLREMHDHPLDMAEYVSLEERYILILISCQSYEEASFQIALNRLNDLASKVDDTSRNELFRERQTIGTLYAKLQDINSAIHFLRIALFDGYLKQQDLLAYDAEIRQTSRLLYEVYECSGMWPDLEVTKKRVRDEFGEDPVASSVEISKALGWCEKKGFTVSERDRQLYFNPLTNENGRTSLHEAALDPKMDMDVLRYLMLPEYYSLRDDSGDTALLLAADRSNYNVVEMLLTIPYLVHVRDRIRRQTPLHRCKDKRTLDLLIEAATRRNSIPPGTDWEPVDINSADCSQRTALHLACQQGRVDLVETLVAHNANVNATCLTGETPLVLACWAADTAKPALEAIVRELVSHGATWEQKFPVRRDPRKRLKARGFSNSDISELTRQPGSSTESSEVEKDASILMHLDS